MSPPGLNAGRCPEDPFHKGQNAPAGFLRARAQFSPDRRRSIQRRRRLAASGPMPPAMACLFTVGELAVLRVVGYEILAHGCCDRSLAEIAARAGVFRKLAQLTLRMAARDGLNVQVPGDRPWFGRPAVRGFVGLLLAACIGVAAYDDAAKQIIAKWAPSSLPTRDPPRNRPHPPPYLQAWGSRTVAGCG
jgi:hypothetical protein